MDPYHGFMFWTENDEKLIQSESFCDENQKYQRKILIDSNNKLGDFVILFDQFKLQIADLSVNTLLELDLASLKSRSATNIK